MHGVLTERSVFQLVRIITGQLFIVSPNRCDSRNVLAWKARLLASRNGPVDRGDLVSRAVGCVDVLS